MIDDQGVLRGVVPTDEAMRIAREVGMDLVEVSPNERPPVCKVMDYGKHKYLLSKKSKQKHHETKIKELRIRPKTDPHDKEIKLKKAREFLEEGHRVQFVMRFKGREKFHQDLGYQTMNDIIQLLAEIGKVEQSPRMFGQRMTMLLVPAKAVAAPHPPKPKPPGAPKPVGPTGPAAAPKTPSLQTAAQATPPA